MLDFLKISTRVRKGVIEVYPKFMIQKTKDLMIRGGDFYAIWIEERGLWSTDENDAIQLIDKALKEHFFLQNNMFCCIYHHTTLAFLRKFMYNKNVLCKCIECFLHNNWIE